VEVADPGAKNGRRRVAVKLGVGNGRKVQVLSGVNEGDKVVLPS
jgi:HlyD family secretion protein